MHWRDDGQLGRGELLQKQARRVLQRDAKRQGIHGRDAVDQVRVEGRAQRHAQLWVEEALQRERGRFGVQQRAVMELDVLA